MHGLNGGGVMIAARNAIQSTKLKRLSARKGGEIYAFEMSIDNNLIEIL